jgi:hypothetical protein
MQGRIMKKKVPDSKVFCSTTICVVVITVAGLFDCTNLHRLSLTFGIAEVLFVWLS